MQSAAKNLISCSCLLLFLFPGCADNPMAPGNGQPGMFPISDDVPVYSYRVLNTYPHDTNAFTQGLVFAQGFLLEGTGLRGSSSLRRVELESGRVIKQLNLDTRYFGEGITFFAGKIIQLTWTSGKGFVYEQSTFDLEREFSYSTQGWGITHDGQNLIMSDGSDKLYFLDPQSYERVAQVSVFSEAGPVSLLNELEFIGGRVFANVWLTDQIVIIDPETGAVTNVIDLTGLLTADEANSADVLNGIAFDAENGRLFVTGKLWPSVFEIELVPQEGLSSLLNAQVF